VRSGGPDADASSVLLPRPRQWLAVLVVLSALPAFLGLAATAGRLPFRPGNAPLVRVVPGDATAGSERLPRCPGRPGHPCRHADIAPPGVDIRRRPSTAALLARDGAADDTARAAQAAGVASAADGSAGTVPCDGDGSDGYRVQALYVVAADRPNRYAAVSASIQAWAAGVDDVINRSAALTGGVRHVRFVTTGDENSGCTPTVVQVVVPAGATADLDATIDAVRAAGYTSAARKYLMWVDANVYCGIAEVYQDSDASEFNLNNGFAAEFARIDSACWGFGDSVEAHELVHTLGAVQGDSPHHTLYGHCFDEYDRMCYDDGSGIAMQEVCPPERDSLLDCGADDYFSTAPTPGSYLATHWNTADSRYLIASGGDEGAAPSVEVSANPMVPGLPTQVSASVTLPDGRHTVSLSFQPSDPACTLTHAAPDADQASLTCPAGTTSPPSVEATVTDSAGGTASATTTLTLDPTPRPSSLELLVDGEPTDAGAWCPITGTLTARLLDGATGLPVAGIPVSLLRRAPSGGPALSIGTPNTGRTGTARATTKLSAAVLYAVTPAIGPWSEGVLSTGQALQIGACTARLTMSSSPAAVRAGGTVSVQGTLLARAGAHSMPATGQRVSVELRPSSGARVVVLGRATVGSDGRWSVVVRPGVSGTLLGRFAGTPGLPAGTARGGALAVRSS